MEVETFQDDEYLICRGTIFDECLNDQEFTDVVIITNDGSQFQCHKIILKAGCPFFKGLFRSEMIETRQNEVNLKKTDISGPHFKLILQYIYTGKIQLNFEDAKAINTLALLFDMKNLKNITEDFLIKNVTNENCLELWRNAEKYFNYKLNDACLIFASAQIFFEAHLADFTMKEIKSIALLEKRNIISRSLFENIVKWIKLDFEERHQYIKDLIGLIDFDDIDDEKFKREIFSDEILKKSIAFLTLTVNYLLRPSNTSISASTQTDAYLVNVPKKTLFVVTSEKIFQTNFVTKEFVPTGFFQKENISEFGLSRHPNNGFITTGGYNNSGILKICNQFCVGDYEVKELPSLVIGRYMHKQYTLGSKIYACGGYGQKTVEIYDEILGRWFNVADMNSERCYFGAADDSVSNLYACNGFNVNSIEHHDIRTKSWHTIYTNQSNEIGAMQSLYNDNKIYCFGEEQGFIFDVRASKELSKIQYKMDGVNFAFQQYSNGLFYDCTLVNDEIWIIGNLNVIDKCNAIRLNLETNQWENKLFRGADKLSGSVGLVWCNNT